MLYVLFLTIAIAYNWWKFTKEREALLASLIEAKSVTHREMILSHHFYVFIFEGFLGFIAAHFITERALAIGMLGLGTVYLILLFLGFIVYINFVKLLERQIQVPLTESFRKNLFKEIRVNFALVLLPILIYSLINITFQGNVNEEWGSLWFIGLIFNILFVSTLTIVCTVIIMLKLIPNREISEPEYLELINRRLEQIGIPNMRVRWVETDIKNAFVVGLKLLRFSNQTMFLGKSLRTTLTMEEFDAVICHELSHVANRHIHKRMMDLMKNFVSVIIGVGFLMFIVIGLSFLYWGEDGTLHTGTTAFISIILCLAWIVFNYALLFDTIRSHEYEADAYAVMELKASLPAWQSALEKLTTPDELPDYLKARTNRGEKGWFGSWFSKYFSTHPSLNARIESLNKKVDRNLPFNYYVSSAQKVRRRLAYVLQWKVAVPLTTAFIIMLTWTAVNFKRGHEMVAWIDGATTEQIKSNTDLISRINTSPTFVGHSMMFYVVKKADPALIDHFIEHGADKGKTLVYISQLKDFNLLEKYYARYQHKLSEDEYFLILRKTAQVDFTDGYRYLVNAKRFEDLNPVYKEDVSRIFQMKRSPASVKK
ncbi:MAG TPA: M48 family metallopeptidase [Bacteriovoracaceae bacterium]|nr:M48 family metallopeptidase [Bacteriovoracaceae bacterium]